MKLQTIQGIGHVRRTVGLGVLAIAAAALLVAGGHASVSPPSIPHSHPHADQPCGNPPTFNAPWQRIRYHSGFHDGHSHDGHGYHGSIQDHVHVGKQAVAPDRDYRDGQINPLPGNYLDQCSPYGARIPITNPYAQLYADAPPYGGHTYGHTYADVYQPFRPYTPYAAGTSAH